MTRLRQRLADPDLVHVVDQTDVGGPVAWVGEPAHHDPEPPAEALTLEQWQRVQGRGDGARAHGAASGGSGSAGPAPALRRNGTLPGSPLPQSGGDQVLSPGSPLLAGGSGASPAPRWACRACGFVGEGLTPFSAEWRRQHEAAHLEAFPDLDAGSRDNVRMFVEQAEEREARRG